jgi:hypothetical protein
MTDTDINESIAEAIGFDFDPSEAHSLESRGKWIKTPFGDLILRVSVPKYCSDLDEIHYAIAYHSSVKASDPGRFYEAFSEQLAMINGYRLGDALTFRDSGFISYATARQRAEAFLRTIGKWRSA